MIDIIVVQKFLYFAIVLVSLIPESHRFILLLLEHLVTWG